MQFHDLVDSSADLLVVALLQADLVELDREPLGPNELQCNREPTPCHNSELNGERDIDEGDILVDGRLPRELWSKKIAVEFGRQCRQSPRRHEVATKDEK